MATVGCNFVRFSVASFNLICLVESLTLQGFKFKKLWTIKIDVDILLAEDDLLGLCIYSTNPYTKSLYSL